jgi:surfactin synthase thioesterase subunit
VSFLRNPSLRELADEVASSLLEGDQVRTEFEAHETASGPAFGSRKTGWLVFPCPRADALRRIFCFNFAGGGAATYRPWGELLAPSIELVAIEPPGRASRIREPHATTLQATLDGLLPEMSPYLDKPFAFFGHCLGGLNLFEVSSHLIRNGKIPNHLFVSGSRPPHRLHALGKFEEDLVNMMLKDREYDPLSPLHEQPDTTFAGIIRQFNIGATESFLAQPELRTALLPAIRADFEIVSRYSFEDEPPWDVPITCFSGLDDHYVSREDSLDWCRYTRREFRIFFRKANHFLVVDDRDFIVSVINSTLANDHLNRHTGQRSPMGSNGEFR